MEAPGSLFTLFRFELIRFCGMLFLLPLEVKLKLPLRPFMCMLFVLLLWLRIVGEVLLLLVLRLRGEFVVVLPPLKDRSLMSGVGQALCGGSSESMNCL